MELFGMHWPPGTANKTRMMRTKGWIPSLQQRCRHQTCNTTATCICSAVTTTPRSWHQLTALLSPSQMAYAQDTAISLGTCHHCSIVPCSAHPSPCLVLVNIRTEDMSNNSPHHTSTPCGTRQHTCKTIGPLTDTSYACTATELQTHSHHPPDAK